MGTKQQNYPFVIVQSWPDHKRPASEIIDGIGSLGDLKIMIQEKLNGRIELEDSTFKIFVENVLQNSYIDAEIFSFRYFDEKWIKNKIVYDDHEETIEEIYKEVWEKIKEDDSSQESCD